MIFLLPSFEPPSTTITSNTKSKFLILNSFILFKTLLIVFLSFKQGITIDKTDLGKDLIIVYLLARLNISFASLFG